MSSSTRARSAAARASSGLANTSRYAAASFSARCAPSQTRALRRPAADRSSFRRATPAAQVAQARLPVRFAVLLSRARVSRITFPFLSPLDPPCATSSRTETSCASGSISRICSSVSTKSSCGWLCPLARGFVRRYSLVCALHHVSFAAVCPVSGRGRLCFRSGSATGSRAGARSRQYSLRGDALRRVRGRWRSLRDWSSLRLGRLRNSPSVCIPRIPRRGRREVDRRGRTATPKPAAGASLAWASRSAALKGGIFRRAYTFDAFRGVRSIGYIGCPRMPG